MSSTAPLTASPTGNPYFFAGKRYDWTSALYDSGARHLDPRVGRFVSRDPLGLWGDSINVGNGTVYAGSNPWSRIDPTGLQSFPGTEALCGGSLPTRPHPPLYYEEESADDDDVRGGDAEHGETEVSDKSGDSAQLPEGQRRTRKLQRKAYRLAKDVVTALRQGLITEDQARDVAATVDGTLASGGSRFAALEAGEDALRAAVYGVTGVNSLEHFQFTLDALSLALDATGIGASVSWAPDLINAGISGATGDFGGAALSLGAMVPWAGAAGNAARIARYADEVGALATTGARHTPAQRALKDLVDDATLGGRNPLSRTDAETVLEWAHEVGYPGARATSGDLASPSNWTGGAPPNIPPGQPHIHLPGAGRSGHVPVQPGVTPWD